MISAKPKLVVGLDITWIYQSILWILRQKSYDILFQSLWWLLYLCMLFKPGVHWLQASACLVSWKCFSADVCMCVCVCVCVFVCVCPSLRLLITSGVMWSDMDSIRLVKQGLQLLYGNCSRYHYRPLSLGILNIHHTLETLTVCHIVIIYCTHCSITLKDCLVLLVMVDWRMSKNMSRMEWM